MAIELKVPSLGESITQATIGAWLKREGEAVQVDEPIVEVESEKATVAVPAPAAGVLRKVLRQSGDTVSVGEVIAELEEGPAQAARGNGPLAPSPRENRLRRTPPSARRLMAEHGLPPETVRGSGPSGQVRKEDVVRALEAPSLPQPLRAPAPAQASTKPPGERERLIPMTPLRRTVARRLLEAQQNAAILTTFNEIDLSAVIALREKHGEAFRAKHGVKLGFMSFFVKASIEGLRAFPAVNAEVRGEAILFKDHYDIGVAVGGGKGLVVPVVRDADQLSFAEIEEAVAGLAKKARENRITMDDLAGGTFTISNGGIYGSLLSTPILNPPQSGILGLHKIEKRAVVSEGDQVVVRPMMYVALSYDHRIVDGREAVSFLVKVKECIEDPERILIEA